MLNIGPHSILACRVSAKRSVFSMRAKLTRWLIRENRFLPVCLKHFKMNSEYGNAKLNGLEIYD